jgi:hypothetical protein
MICVVINAIISNILTIERISKIMKKEDSNYYEYRSPSEIYKFMKYKSFTKNELIPYSSSHLYKLLKREMNFIFTVIRTGNINFILKYTDVI